MSYLIKSLFGNSSTKIKDIPNFSETIEKNNETTRDLQRKIDWIETKNIIPNISKIKILAKKNTKRDTEAAKKILIINHRYTTQIKNMQAQIDNLISIRIAIEGSLMTKNVFDTIQQSTQALKSTMPSIDSVEDILADTEESISQTNEITEALSTPLQFGMPIDPDDLDDELRELMNEINEPEIILPNVPITKLPEIIRHTTDTTDTTDTELEDLLSFAN